MLQIPNAYSLYISSFQKPKLNLMAECHRILFSFSWHPSIFLYHAPSTPVPSSPIPSLHLRNKSDKIRDCISALSRPELEEGVMLKEGST